MANDTIGGVKTQESPSSLSPRSHLVVKMGTATAGKSKNRARNDFLRGSSEMSHPRNGLPSRRWYRVEYERREMEEKFTCQTDSTRGAMECGSGDFLGKKRASSNVAAAAVGSSK